MKYLALCLVLVAAVGCTEKKSTPHKDKSDGMNRFHDDKDHNPSHDNEMYLATYLQHYYNQFDDLSVEQRKEKFKKEVIPGIDKNADQKITLEEMDEWVIQKIEEDAKLLHLDHVNFTEIDTDGDGKFSLTEVLNDFKKHMATPNEVSEPGLIERQVKKEEARFHFSDQNKDGFIDKTELPRLVLPEHFRNTLDMYKQHFRLDYDSDGNGIITKKEFIRNSENDPNFDNTDQMVEQFDAYDKNGDSSLNDQEIAEAAADYESIDEVKQELETIFHLANPNNVKAISAKELEDVHEYFTDRNSRLPLGDNDHDEL